GVAIVGADPLPGGVQPHARPGGATLDARTRVLDFNRQPIALAPGAHSNVGVRAQPRAVTDRVLHQRLQDQHRHEDSGALGAALDLEPNLPAQADLFDFQVLPPSSNSSASATSSRRPNASM